MTLSLQDIDDIEKTPLERYVAPEKPSLIGFTRGQLSEALGSVGVPEAQRKMRVQQLWHWIYFRGFTSFEEGLDDQLARRRVGADHRRPVVTEPQPGRLRTLR